MNMRARSSQTEHANVW